MKSQPQKTRRIPARPRARYYVVGSVVLVVVDKTIVTVLPREWVA